MTVGLSAGDSWYELGAGSFVHSFFSTISYHLEPNGWGSRFPVLMQSLYHEAMSKEQNDVLLREVQEVRELLTNYSPDQVIWDIEDLSKQPPWGKNISSSITSLANYFVTSDGNDLFEVLIEAITEAIRSDSKLAIE